MLSKISTKKQFVIVGAGISGLSLGWYLKKRFQEEIELTILDSQSRCGGWIETVQHNGFLFEIGPRSCRPYGNGIETLKLIESLGLQNELIFASPEASRRYIFSDQKLSQLPASLWSLAFSPFSTTLIKALWRDWRAKKIEVGIDESIADFATRRLGRNIADMFFDPLVSGIYAGDISKLSMKSCFPILYDWEQNHGSLLGGAFAKRDKSKHADASAFVQCSQKKGLFSLRKGMESLIAALTEKLCDSIRLSSKVTGIEFQGGRQLEQKRTAHKANILLEDGQAILADHIFMAIPPAALGTLMQPHHPALAQELNAIPSVSVGIVNIGFSQKVLDLKGFGYLIPSKEKEEILGVVWDSCAFPSQNQTASETRLTVMIGEPHLPQSADHSILEKIALRAIAKHLHILQKPDSISVKIAKKAIPQYHVGHSQRLQSIEEGLLQFPTPISLLGNGFYGVAVNDCIARAQAIAASIRP